MTTAVSHMSITMTVRLKAVADGDTGSVVVNVLMPSSSVDSAASIYALRGCFAQIANRMGTR